jgi:hypothetical protein
VSAEILRHELGVSWVDDGPLARTSHALADGGRVWLIDAFDDPDALTAAAELGEPVAVLQLLERHGRDCRAIAERLGVPYVRCPDSVPDSPFEVVTVLRTPVWHETALWWPERRALVVPETVGTGPTFALDGGPAGIHPLLRALPPGRLRAYQPEHLLPSHGPPLHGAAAADGLRYAYAHSRRDVPRMLTSAPALLRAARAAWLG